MESGIHDFRPPKSLFMHESDSEHPSRREQLSRIFKWCQHSMVYVLSYLSPKEPSTNTRTAMLLTFGWENHRPTNFVGLMSPIGDVPTTPDRDISAKISWYKWELYRNRNGRCIYSFQPRRGHTGAKASR